MDMPIRNFSIIAHIDHGKTTLTDRLLEFTGTIVKGFSEERLMDSNPIEKERGITIKLAPVQMEYQGHILNLIDTPGHVDFSYEVSRSLKACEGAILVVDATKGVQAQTIANLTAAREEGLVIIPALNKIDLDSSEPERVTRELVALGFTEDEILKVSAKTGDGVEALLQAVIDRVPAPIVESIPGLKAFIFNSTFHTHMGVIAFVKVVAGELNKGNLSRLLLHATKTELSPLEIGVFKPDMKRVEALPAGTVGYIATGLKDIREVTVGDTVTTIGATIVPVPGYERPQPMVFMDLYPVDADQYRDLVDALGKLALNDASLTYKPAASPALGHGFRIGFLGILHAEIVVERLSREFNLEVVNTSPSVPYHIHLRGGDSVEVSSPADFPAPEHILHIEEPIVTLTIFTPEKYVGGIMELCQNKRATFIDMQYIADRVQLNYMMPLIELITNFYDKLKSVSSGYASVQYDHAGYDLVDAVKVDVLLNGTVADALSFIVPRGVSESKSRVLVEKLKGAIPRMQFEIPIQAVIGGKIIARETVRAYRKDVEAKLHGGDMSRNRKLLDKQKKGKKRMKQIGSVQVPQEAFTEILKL
jgi:GTP-binding protein LepA